MAKKAPQRSTDIQPLAKSCHWQDWLAPEAYRFYPGKHEWRQRLMLTLLMWYDDKDEEMKPVLDVMDFSIQYKIPPRTLRHYKLTYPDIQEIYNDVKELLAYRRKLGALRKTLDREMVLKDLHVMDPSWHKEVNAYWNEMKKEEAAAGGIQVVEIPVQRSTGKIPPKKEKV